jgi:cyclopropane fatty-acyl-phospholipid synthase-like methyltransferase
MDMTSMNEKFTWAVRLLKLKTIHNILEIGCGAGLLAEQIAHRLTTGN